MSNIVKLPVKPSYQRVSRIHVILCDDGDYLVDHESSSGESHGNCGIFKTRDEAVLEAIAMTDYFSVPNIPCRLGEIAPCQ